MPLIPGFIVVSRHVFILLFLPTTHPIIESVVVYFLWGKDHYDILGRVESITFSFFRGNIKSGEEQESMYMGRSG